jgi:anti-anti-sigma factor
MHGPRRKETVSSPFEIESHQDGDAVRIVVRGEVDLTTGDRLEREILAAEERRPATLTIDLTGVGFLDSTGLQIVLDADVRAREEGRRVLVVAGDSEAARVFTLTSVAERLTVTVIE